MKKFKLKELLTRDEMKKITGSGYCSTFPCGPPGASCQLYLGGCRCVNPGVYYGMTC